MDELMQSIAVAEILPGKNPRMYFDAAKMTELEDSIRAQNLIQPILVRRTEAGFELVAGERRLRAYTNVFGRDSKIPALIRDLSAAEADQAALVENVLREAMTPVEEAQSAAKILGSSLGDRDEAAKRLGWSRSMLDKRLALMNACDTVREALQDRKIMLGHAELLAALRKESQESAITHLLQQSTMMTVSELKAFVETQALDLGIAIFDKADCAGCLHNSGNQSALFAEAITGGRCTNKACYDDKTEGQLNATAASLKDDYQVIRIVRAGDNLTVIPLVAGGPKGVGEEQAQACRLCKDFGAVVSAVADKLGKVYKDLCLNVPCNTKLVAVRVKAEQDAQATATAQATLEKAAKTQPSDPKSSPPPGTTGEGAKAAAAGKSGATKKEPELTQLVEPSGRLKEYREKVWRGVYKITVPKLETAQNRLVLLALCLSRPSNISSHELENAVESILTTTGSRHGFKELLLSILDLDTAPLGLSLAQIPAQVGADFPIGDVQLVLKTFEIKLEGYWKVEKAFFELLTKSEIGAICTEIGIKAALGTSYANLLNGPKEDLIKAVASVPGFDYKGRIPAVMRF